MKNQTENPEFPLPQTDIDTTAASVMDPEAFTLLQAENAEPRATIQLSSRTDNS